MDTPQLVAQIRARLQAGDGYGAMAIFHGMGYTGRVELKWLDDSLYVALAEREIRTSLQRGQPAGPFRPPAPYLPGAAGTRIAGSPQPGGNG
jgi:hypothetical protein